MTDYTEYFLEETMSLQSVRQFFADHAPDVEVIELGPLPLRWLPRPTMSRRVR